MKTTYFILLVVASTVQLSKQDNCHWRELELCAATGLLALQNNPIPQSEAEIDNQCTYIKESIACGDNYTDKCATPLYKQLISFGSAESRENMESFCTPGNELRKTLLKHAECLADAWNEQQACTTDARAAIEKISSVANKDKINLACCTYRRFRLCGTDLIGKKCGAEAKDFVLKFISFFVSNLPDIVCQNFSPEEPPCKALLPPIGTPPSGDKDSPLNQIINMFSAN
uniref:Venom protein VP6 n=1 Tax=Odontobuthus doriae TaxID=342590 RepID=A0A0U3YCW0_ODODO|nr:venom protein VP6 [Odontobuthus doriae]